MVLVGNTRLASFLHELDYRNSVAHTKHGNSILIPYTLSFHGHTVKATVKVQPCMQWSIQEEAWFWQHCPDPFDVLVYR